MAWPTFLWKAVKILTPFLATPIVTIATRSAQERAEDFISKKREEFVSHARTEAELFMAEQIALIEQKVDTKISELERKIDEQIEKEIRSKLRVLIYTLLAVIFMSAISLGYLYLKKRLGL